MKSVNAFQSLVTIACQLMCLGLCAQNSAILNGTWKKASCETSTFSGVTIQVSGNNGQISEKGNSPFDIGQIVWTSIQNLSSNEFQFRSLSNDGNYYEGKIIVVGQELVTISPSQLGGIQKWVKQTSVAKSFNLDGEWVRVAGNNSGANGMTLTLKGNKAVITNPAQTRLKSGDIKWKDITFSPNGAITHQELGSDYNYYAASMKQVDANTLDISVLQFGAGNVQKWVRKNPTSTTAPNISIDPIGNNQIKVPNPNAQRSEEVMELFTKASEPKELSCDISTPERLINGPGAVDYVVSCVIDITSRLDIEPGTVIQFKENAGLGIYDGGILNAVGNSSAPISFQGVEDIPGYWRGIHIETKSNSNVLEHVNIKNAGSNYVYCCNAKASLFIKGAKLRLKKIRLSNGGDIGIVAIKGSEIPVYESVTVTGHQGPPLQFDANLVRFMDNGGSGVSDYSGNDKNYVLVTGHLTETSTWNAPNVPYLIAHVMDVTQPLSIKPGAVLQFENEAGLGVFDRGGMEAKGTAEAPIIFEGLKNMVGYWRGIHIETKDPNNSLHNVIIRNAGSNYVYCCNTIASLFFKGALISLSNVTLEKGKNDGLVALADGTEFIQYNNVTIREHRGYPLQLHSNLVKLLDGTASNYSDNTKNVALVNGKLNAPSTWKKLNIPYQLEKVLDVTEAFALEPGVSIMFAENAGIGVYDRGSFKAIGTASEPIVLRGKEEVQGYWRGIHIETNSNNNLIRDAIIINAGSNYVYCCNQKAAVFLQSGQATIENSVISKSGGCAIYAKRSANLMETGNTYANNQLGNVCRN